MAWLELISHSPQIRQGKTAIPFQCMRLGWTRYRKRELTDLWPREELTDEGRRVLAEYLAQRNEKT